MENKYISAVDKLEFSGDLLEAVVKKRQVRYHHGKVRIVLIAAALIAMLATTAFAGVAVIRQRQGRLVLLGTSAETMQDAEVLHFRLSEEVTGVELRYMELEPKTVYSFCHGMLYSKGDYLKITEDGRLEPIQLRRVNDKIQKKEKNYHITFDYLETEKGILSGHRTIYVKNEQGEILLHASNGGREQWPVYLNVTTGKIRDALPGWSPEDFEGRVVAGYALKHGFLVVTLVEDTKLNFCLLENGTGEAKTITLPEENNYQVEYENLYYQNEEGHLFVLGEDLEFHQISEYDTVNFIQDGLLTVSVEGKLGILDTNTGDTFLFDEISAQRWELIDYVALRYGSRGPIALVQTQWLHDPERIVLKKLGILDQESGELKLLNIENDFDGYQHAWLDDHRFAVVYRSGVRQFLCIYEFTE